MGAALLLNADMKVQAWQLRCIECIASEIETVYIAVEKSKAQKKQQYRKSIRHMFYYLLNIKSIRLKSYPIDVKSMLSAKIYYIEYTANQRGWAQISSRSVESILNDSPEYIYKCGLGLLSVPAELKDIPIISHHHGDPSRYRGRPAGFYEILANETAMGQVVQVLCNKLDAGRILAFGESKISDWSYRKTLRDSYAISPYLLATAIRNVRDGTSLCIETEGRNNHLPSNRVVVRFIIHLVTRKLKRLIYAAFYEKKWNIAVIENPEGHTVNPWKLLQHIRLKPKGSRQIVVNKKYSFYADAFLLGDNIIAEGLRKSDGIGELVELNAKYFNVAKIVRPDFSKQPHISYPYVMDEGSKTFVYPESAKHKKPFALRKNKDSDDGFETIVLADIPVKSGITDPSVFKHEGRYYMFGNLPSESNILRLWVGNDSIMRNAIEHPLSPVRFGPRGSRGGGKIFVNDDQIFRIGQDLSYGYGDGLILFRISKITPSDFQEDLIGQIRFDLLHGPHTFDANEKLMCWDYYREEFSVFAGYKRLIAAIKSLSKSL